MTINSSLEAIIAASPEGKKPILTAPIDVTHMPALDGKTMLPVSSQLAAFYYFAGSWRFQDFDLQWLDP
ncbi:MAG: hypothetical protein Q4G26_08385, partial [Paracoccus sp. (in: a-proteobacteria)]|nr:hypothetical protein [Paracoccus sp. (in: a-proteobacteria)]